MWKIINKNDKNYLIEYYFDKKISIKCIDYDKFIAKIHEAYDVELISQGYYKDADKTKWIAGILKEKGDSFDFFKRLFIDDDSGDVQYGDFFFKQYHHHRGEIITIITGVKLCPTDYFHLCHQRDYVINFNDFIVFEQQIEISDFIENIVLEKID
jgi:hypothetical protein